jgi:steroid delta-isomerase-like uncharacterized protein
MAAAWQARDVERYLELYADDMVFADVNQRQRVEGLEAYRKLSRQVFGVHKTLGLELRRRVISGPHAALEAVWSGSIDGAVLGTPGQDKSYSYSGVIWLEAAGGKIRRETHYIDFVTFREQFGLAPAGETGRALDLRPEPLRQAGPTEAGVRAGRELLRQAAERHGLQRWRSHTSFEAVWTDDWAPKIFESGYGWWPIQKQRLRTRALLGTFSSQVELLDGPHKGEIWGVQSFLGYKKSGQGGQASFGTEKVLTFYLPALQYFNELPFRLLAAEHVADAGTGSAGGRTYRLVYATWGSFEPNLEHDQYVLWIDPQSLLVEMCRYTVRDASPDAAGTILFSDYLGLVTPTGDTTPTPTPTATPMTTATATVTPAVQLLPSGSGGAGSAQGLALLLGAAALLGRRAQLGARLRDR